MNKRKPLFAFVILLILIIAFLFGIRYAGFFSNTNRSADADQKISGMRSMLHRLEDYFNTSETEYFRKLQSLSDLMTASLQVFVNENGYDGPEIFSDGIVISVRDGKIVYPEGFSGSIPDLTPEFLSEFSEPTELPLVENGETSRQILLNVTPVSETYYYLDMTDPAEIRNVTVQGSITADTLSSMENTYDAYLFIVDAEDLSFIYYSDGYADLEAAGDFSVSQKMLEAEEPEIRAGVYTFTVNYENLRLGDQSAKAVILTRPITQNTYYISCVSAAALFIFIVVSGLILWIHWINVYQRDHSLTERQKLSYAPEHVRRIAIAGIFNGTLLLFLALLAYQALGNLSRISSTNGEMLNILKRETESSSNQASFDRDDRMEWEIYFAERIAVLYANHPELQTGAFLQTANELIGSEYIMVFGRDGKELASSNNWLGFTLGQEIPSTEDFRFLLRGVRKLILDPEMDRFSGKTLQLLGVCMDLADGDGYGAVVIAVDQQKSDNASIKSANQDIIRLITSRKNLAIVGDKESNTVLFASDQKLENMEYRELGMENSDLVQTIHETFDISGIKYYGAFDYDDQYDYYYMTEASSILDNTFKFAGFSALSFLVISMVVCVYLLDFSRINISEEAAVVKEDMKKYSRTAVSGKQEAAGQILSPVPEMREDRSLSEWWRDVTPERKFAGLMQILLTVSMSFALFVLMNSNEFGSKSVLNFILQGNWKRGFNELAVFAILCVIAVLVYFILVKNLLLRVLLTILNAKGETIARLFSSLLQYAAIITSIFYCLSYLGFDTGVLVTSAGILTLAVSLGSKDLIADILAGIMLIFDGSFHVGDKVEVNGFSGTVVDIGVHSTKIMDIGNNLKVIGNQSVNNYLKKADHTAIVIDLTIFDTQAVYEIETLLNEKLPEIGASIPEITIGPIYRGISEIGYRRVVVSIFAKCLRQDEIQVKLKLNHALKELFDENGFKL